MNAPIENGYKILIIEDEENIRGFLKINLKKNNFIVDEAGSGEEGLAKIRLNTPDIILLDVMLPGIDGFEVLKQIRESYSNIGVIMLTAKSQDIDKIKGFENGADDYVLKPFNNVELVLRVKSLLRRLNVKQENYGSSPILTSCEFSLDIYSQKLTKGGKEIFLTPKEYLLIKLFMENQDKAFSRDELMDKVWGYDYFGDTKIVDGNIRRLRGKIEGKNSTALHIETVWGTGYRWRKE